MRSLEDLLPDLTSSTVSDRLRWENADGFLPDAYWANLGSNSIVALSWTTEDDRHTGYTIQLLRGKDRPGYPIDVIDAVSDDEFGPNYSAVRELYTAARRSALKVGDVVDEVEAFLNGLPVKAKIPPG